MFLGFDFVENDPVTGQSRIVQRQAEMPEQRYHRNVFAGLAPKFTIPDTTCSHCGLVM